ncbi:helix-turn-helix transcriptional regulator [Cytobacillus horneckiae]|uniref:helix-turn-helix transcriptional regulator n=1 Tax=Cytobacillus horneckiae TaxID=549687 RepID=UPI00203E16F4|nr:helix-turn-helix domain-containing protein [Cytobacillus horneckiae]
MKNELNFKSVEEFKSFIESELLTTREVADLLGCSRQNIKQLVDYKTLVPVKQTSRERLFFKADVIDYMNNKKAFK